MTLTGVRPGGRFGEIGLENGMVTSFLEKPDDSPSYVNGGFFVMKKSVGELLSGDECILERSPLETLSKAGQLAAYQHDGFWQCMDNIREMTLLNELWNGGKAPWKTW
nr:hypothetical protein [Verrucomicrobium spinosum]